MEPDIATPNKDRQERDKGLSLRWSARLSLTTRILVVNVLAIALLAGGLFYLNNYRDRLTEERLAQARVQLTIMPVQKSADPSIFKPSPGAPASLRSGWHKDHRQFFTGKANL